MSALLRRAVTGGAFAAVAQKGDRDAGAVIVTVRTRDGMTRLYQSATGMDGNRVWHEGTAQPAREIDAQISRYSARDPDLWIIEIEDRDGRHFLTEALVKAVGI